MKNTHIKDLLSEVPKDIRLEVYKEALEYYRDKPHIDFVHKEGLCLRLPVILWDLEGYHSFAPNGHDWDFGDTGIAFPELEDRIIDSIMFSNTVRAANDLRIEYLTQWIEDLENN